MEYQLIYKTSSDEHTTFSEGQLPRKGDLICVPSNFYPACKFDRFSRVLRVKEVLLTLDNEACVYLSDDV